jgi:hypothetical protein
MANAGKITVGVGFNVDKSGLKDVTNELKTIQNLAEKQQTRQPLLDLSGTIEDAQTLENILYRTYNQKLDTYNITAFQKELQSAGLSMDSLYNEFASLGPEGVAAFEKINTAVLTSNKTFQKTKTVLDKMGETLANTIKWNISSAAVNKLSGSLQEAYGYVQHLDSSLNDIRIVTGQSAEEMASFAEQANEAASALGRTTTDYTEASLIFAQQGLTGDELTARTEATLKAANVTGQTASAVSEQLTAVWNGFKVGAEDTEQAVDILAAVAASTASDLEELSTGMSKVASAANLMGVNEEQLAAQLSTIISVTRQAPENVGTALTFRA